MIKRDGNIELLPQFTNQMISSSIDFDRMDYLLRDSYNLGIPYGAVGYRQLMRSLRLSGDDNKLCIEKKGISVADGFIISRISMYVQVYSHPVNIAFSTMVKHIYEHDSKLFPRVETIKEDFTPEMWCSFDDDWFRRQLNKTIITEGNEKIKRLAQMFRDRKNLKLAHEKLSWDQDDSFGKYEILLNSLNNFRDFPLNEDEYFLGCQPLKFSDIAPLIDIKRIKEQEDVQLKDEVYVISDKGYWEGERLLMDMKDSILSQMAGKTLEIQRIYTFPKHQEVLNRYIQEKCNEQDIEI